jgi:di/tricarboxylate transporter
VTAAIETTMVTLLLPRAALLRPVSSAVNMLVQEAGGYSFGDYVKLGVPLLLLTMLVTIALVAVLYPF